jgi:uncharacterized membrane protein
VFNSAFQHPLVLCAVLVVAQEVEQCIGVERCIRQFLFW